MGVVLSVKRLLEDRLVDIASIKYEPAPDETARHWSIHSTSFLLLVVMVSMLGPSVQGFFSMANMRFLRQAGKMTVEVTTPNVLPPAPRSAQNKSLLWF